MRLPIQYINTVILMVLLISLSGCEKEVVKTSASINGDNYVDSYNITIVDHRELIPRITFLEEFNLGNLTLKLNPVDKNRPSYQITIYLKGSRTDFGKGKVYKIGYTDKDLPSIEWDHDNLIKCIPDRFDGIAVCSEIIDGNLSYNTYQPTVVNYVNLIGEIEIATDKNRLGYYEGKYNFKSVDKPILNITNGYLKVRI